MPDMNLNIDGSAGGAVAAIAEVKAALATLTGKTVVVDVQTKNSGGGGGNPTSILDALRQRLRGASDDNDRFAASNDRASDAVKRHASANDRGADSARAASSAHSRASDAVKEHAEANDRASESARSSSSSHSDATRSVNGYGSAHQSSARYMQSSTRATNELAAAQRSLTQARVDYGRAFDEARDAASGSPFEKFTAAHNATADLQKQMQAAQAQVDKLMSSSSGSSGSTSRSGSPLETLAAAGPKAAEALNIEQPAASYVARQGQMFAATQKLADAQDEAARATTAYKKAHAEAFDASPEKSVTARNAAAELAAAPQRAAMDDANAAARRARTEVDGLRQAFRETGKTAGEAMSSAGETLGRIGGIAGQATQGVAIFGIAAGVSAIAMGALGAATAGVGVGAALGDIMKSEPMMSQARKGVEGFTDAFHKMSSQTADAGLPGMRSLTAATGTLGTTLAKIGVDHMAEGLNAATILTAEATGAIKQLEPAITPATNAVTALGGAALGALGNSAPTIAQFANVVTQAAPGLQSFAEAGIQGMSTLGGEFVKVTAAAAPLLHTVSNVVGGATDLFNGLTGMDSSFSSKPGPDGSTPQQSTLNKIGSAVNSVGKYVAPFIPGPISSAYQAAEAVMGGGSNEPNYPMTSTVGGYAMPLYPQAANPLLGQTAAPGQATFVPDLKFPGTPGYQAPAAPAAPPPAAPSRSIGFASDDQLQGKKPLTLPQVGGGSGLGVQTAQARQLTAEVNNASQSMQRMQPAAQTAGQAVQQHLQQAGGAAQAMPQQVQRAAAQIPQAVAQPMAQVPRAAQQAMQPQAMAQPMQHMVNNAVSQVQPAAQSAGADLGASVPTGASQGITREEDVVVTTIRKLIEKVIDAGATGLDSHSPSRIFAGLGESIPQGLAVGVENEARQATNAVANLMGGVVGTGASALGSPAGGGGAASFGLPQVGGGSSLPVSGGSVSSQLAALTGGGTGSGGGGGLLGALTRGGDGGLLPGGFGGLSSALNNLNGYVGGVRSAADQHRAAVGNMSDDQRRLQDERDAGSQAGHAGGSGGGPGFLGPNGPETKEDREKRQQAYSDNRSKQLDPLGYSQATKDRIIGNEEKRGDNQRRIQNQRTQNQEYARYNARYPDSGLMRGDITGMGNNPISPQAIAEKNQREAYAAAQQQSAQRAQLKSTAGGAGFSLGGTLGGPVGALLGAGSAIAGAVASSQENGHSVAGGFAQGIKQSAGDVADAGKDMASQMLDKTKKTLGIASPSTVMAGVGGDTTAGLAQGMGSALSSASTSISGIADNTGLMVGYQWATAVGSGIQSIFKQSDYQSNAIPQIGSELAMTALGLNSLLGASAGGGLVNKNPAVTIGGSSAAPAQSVQVHVYLDGQPFSTQIATQINDALGQLADARLAA